MQPVMTWIPAIGHAHSLGSAPRPDQVLAGAGAGTQAPAADVRTGPARRATRKGGTAAVSAFAARDRTASTVASPGRLDAQVAQDDEAASREAEVDPEDGFPVLEPERETGRLADIEPLLDEDDLAVEVDRPVLIGVTGRDERLDRGAFLVGQRERRGRRP